MSFCLFGLLRVKNASQTVTVKGNTLVFRWLIHGSKRLILGNADDSSALHGSLATVLRARIISTQAVKFRRYPKERCFVLIP